MAIGNVLPIYYRPTTRLSLEAGSMSDSCAHATRSVHLPSKCGSIVHDNRRDPGLRTADIGQRQVRRAVPRRQRTSGPDGYTIIHEQTSSLILKMKI